MEYIVAKVPMIINHFFPLSSQEESDSQHEVDFKKFRKKFLRWKKSSQSEEKLQFFDQPLPSEQILLCQCDMHNDCG